MDDVLLKRACIDIESRQLNNGSWPHGIPESFRDVAVLHKIDQDNHNWMMIVEHIISMAAIKSVANSC